MKRNKSILCLLLACMLTWSAALAENGAEGLTVDPTAEPTATATAEPTQTAEPTATATAEPTQTAEPTATATAERIPHACGGEPDSRIDIQAEFNVFPTHVGGEPQCHPCARILLSYSPRMWG